MRLDDVVMRLAAVLSFRAYTCDERVSLDPDAAAYCRNHMDMFPTDPRPFLTPADVRVL